MIRAAAYLRASTDQQDQSAKQQLDELKLYAHDHGREIVRVFEDSGQSGTTFVKRPGFVEMLRIVESGEADFEEVLVYDESRWGRAVDPRENSYWKKHFSRYGVTINVINSKSSGGNDVGSYVLEVVESAEASEYSKKLGRATLRGSIDTARQGFSSGGTPSYGYVRIAVNKFTREKLRDLPPGSHTNEDEKCLWDIGDQREVEVVRRIFESKIKGVGDVAIADMLNREGIPPPKRGRWKNKDQKWSGVTVRTILTNPTYYGARVYNRHPQSHLAGPDKEVWINDREKWIVVEGAHPAIVSKETYELANRDRKDYKRKNHYFYSSPYLLSGLIICSHCGFRFQGQNYQKKNIRYYEDGGYMNKGHSVCSSFKINKEKLEDFVIKAIRSKILNSDLPKRLEELLQEKVKQASLQKLSSVEYCEKELTEVKLKIERLLTLAENGVNLPEQVDKLKNAEREKKQIERKLEELKVSQLSRKEIVEAKVQVQNLMVNFEDVLKNSPVHIQKELLRKFVHVITVDRQSDTIIVQLKKVPSVSPGLNGNSAELFGCVNVEKKVNRNLLIKTRHSQKIHETNQTSETTVTPETNESVLTENRSAADTDAVPVG